jgi:hypothetical protein
VPDGWLTVVISLVGAVTGAFGVELIRQFAARGERRMSFDERQREQLAARVPRPAIISHDEENP